MAAVTDPKRIVPSIPVLIAAACLALSGCTSKAHWEKVHEDRQTTLAVDSSSIQRGSTVTKAWVLSNHAQPVAAPPKHYQSEISLFQFRCGEQRYGLERANLYETRDGKGEMVDTLFPKDISWNQAQPGSGMLKVVEFVCRGNS